MEKTNKIEKLTNDRHAAFKMARKNKGCCYTFDAGDGWTGWTRYDESKRRCVTYIEKNGVMIF